ncbi:MAG: xanthine dehydrogenase small subunit [Burkholderiaceae bacterium]|nr:xanthine dehydrogenase small subunit [Burkholderiaceae bacterium]
MNEPPALPPNPQPIRFWLGGRWREVQAVAPDRTLLEWLRDDAAPAERRCGTKEGCAEGDCGACTVVLGRADGAGGLELQPANACIRLLPTLHGLAVFTVEDLGRPGALHPVQQAMVEQHGSQCGFCTPGFVMSLWFWYHDPQRNMGKEAIDAALAGNLCRCTGYRPIVAAAQAAAAVPPPATDLALRQAAARALAEHDEAARRSDLHYRAAGIDFHAPASLPALAALVEQQPQARVFAGATDVGLWVTKQHRSFERWIWLGRVAELQRIDAATDAFDIGAAVSVEHALAALEGDWPSWRALRLRFASPAIRAAATLAGNVANGSPIGDAMPGLLALGATLRLRQGAQSREVPLDAFYLGYQRKDLRAGEFVEAVRVPRRWPRADGRSTAAPRFRIDKLSKRRDQDISSVCLAVALLTEAPGAGAAPVVTQLRIGVGGLAAVPARARAAEAALQGRALDAAAIDAAAQALAGEFTPLSDQRASAEYRRRAAQALLQRMLRELAAEAAGAAPPPRLDDLLPLAAAAG